MQRKGPELYRFRAFLVSGNLLTGIAVERFLRVDGASEPAHGLLLSVAHYAEALPDGCAAIAAIREALGPTILILVLAASRSD